MNPKIERFPRTDEYVDNSYYLITSYEEIVDDEGTTHYIAKKSQVLCNEYDAQVAEKNKEIEEQIAILKNKALREEQIEALEEQKITLPNE